MTTRRPPAPGRDLSAVEVSLRGCHFAHGYLVAAVYRMDVGNGPIEVCDDCAVALLAAPHRDAIDVTRLLRRP